MLPLLAALVIAFGVVMYVVLDGFDLGIGILFPLAADEEQRDRMMNSIAPVWDGNETWLVLGGVALFAAFPRAYGTLLPAFYLPVMVMLFGLVFRGVAFEFRFRAHTRRHWSRAFAAASILAAFAQGVVLGAFIDGFSQRGLGRAGTLDWLSWFSLLTGLALVAGYGMLGATWLAMKIDGDLRDLAYRLARVFALAVFVFIAIVSLWTAFLNPHIAARWFSAPNIYGLWLVPFVTVALGLLLLRALARRRPVQPFLLAIGVFLLCYLGLGISLWPIIVPPSLTIWAAASRSSSAVFLLTGVGLTLPFILAYSAYNYYVFRGRVAGGDGYHQ